ncbi:MAG TPA: secretin N-terminal domain-containing protein [Candidatus Bathyarchaeia archaeon]|nr:secretin N-terminal domain-containing protein [Candidatus Bathyarchaeia archaeon]
MRLSTLNLLSLLIVVALLPAISSLAQEAPAQEPAPAPIAEPADTPPPPPPHPMPPQRVIRPQRPMPPALPEGMQTEIFDLKYVSPDKLSSLIQFFMLGEFMVDEELNLLAVRGNPEAIDKTRQLVQKYDVPRPPERVEVRIYLLTAATDQSLAVNLTSLPNSAMQPPRRPQEMTPTPPETVSLQLRPLPPELQQAAAQISDLYGVQQLGVLSVMVAQTQEDQTFTINGAVPNVPRLDSVAEGAVRLRRGGDNREIASLELSFQQESQQVRSTLEMYEGEYLVVAENSNAASQPVWTVVGVKIVR